MLEVREIGRLRLEAPAAPGRRAHLSAASGIVRAGGFTYVVADDELALGVFGRPGEAGRLLPLLAGELPLDHAERKAAKPDFEALVRLPAFGPHEAGALLALGSGSTPARRRGVVVPLGNDGQVAGPPVVIDLAPLYEVLHGPLDELNIEGACVAGDRLALLQRGNTTAGENIVVWLALDELLDEILRDGRLAARTLAGLTRYELRAVGDPEVVLTFTDASSLPDGRLVFSAAAEDTTDPYEDGAIVGSAVGVLDAAGQLTALELLHGPEAVKVEGVDAAAADGDDIDLLMVCDADDPEIASPLLAGRLRS